MQCPPFSAHSILEALALDTACVSLLEQTPEYQKLAHAKTPEAIYTAIQAIGRILNVQEPADRLVEDLEERINIITHKLKFIATENKPKIAFLHNTSPLTLAPDDYLANLTRTAGAIPQTGNWATTSNPDVLIVFSEKSIAQSLTELPNVLSAWSHIHAVTNNRIYIVHHSGYLRRPGAGVADDTEILAEIIYPNYFVFGRDNDVWMKFEWQ